MYLKHIDILGFRGINRLSLALKSNSVLIGENAWGKSSLLDALSILSPDDTLYKFTEHDFHFPPGESHSKERYLQIIYTFADDQLPQAIDQRYQHLSALFVATEENKTVIYLSLEAELDADGSVTTRRSFIDGEGDTIRIENIDYLVSELIRLNPVLRLRDARFVKKLSPGAFAGFETLEQHELKQHLHSLTERLTNEPQTLTNHELRSGLGAMQQLLEHYLSATGTGFKRFYSSPLIDKQAWQSLDAINTLIEQSNSRTVRLLLLGLMITLIEAKNNVRLDMNSNPILLIEDPENGLHPVNLAIAWGFFNQLPLQRITLTNSGDLLKLTPIKYIHRLVRESSRVKAFSVKPSSFSTDENRRISFHIRMNRATSLFARSWLLVEGETEIWLLNELAQLCGYNFETEGIKIIEYAQCGLKPLIKLAMQLGIEWYVLTDGDDAGKRYAQTAKSFMDKLEVHHRLTSLPAFDMEHFMYREGFMHVYRRVSGYPDSAPIAPRRIIEKAIHRSSKPDLAIEIALEAKKLGIDSVPLLLRKLFTRLVGLARGKAD